jgi:hexulose-6-phosphate isomerase
MNRRTFLMGSAAALGAGVLAQARATAAEVAAYVPLKKGVQYGKLPKDLDDAEKFRIAREAGFDGVEAYPMADLAAAAEVGRLARAAGVPVHSITYGGWGAPMSSPDPAVISKGHAEIENGLRTAKAMGADVMLLVPAVVNESVSYESAWKNSQANIRPMLPLAEELGVVIAVENVWSKFLLSPIEFAAYVDEFESDWVKAYFDCGNVVIFGYPEQWIATLGKRIVRAHVKGFHRDGFRWTPLYEDSIDWPAVRRAFDAIGYTGWITEELGDQTVEELHELSRRMSLIGQGAAQA